VVVVIVVLVVVTAVAAAVVEGTGVMGKPDRCSLSQSQ